MTGHKHTFTALYAHFGWHRKQEADETDEHYHVCFSHQCDTILVGPGWSCDGNVKTHHEEPPSQPPETFPDMLGA